jgi:uncharacterized UBP type Zn finger protein
VDQLIENPMGIPMMNVPQFQAPPSEESIEALTGMGFTRAMALRALERSGNNLEIATNLLLDTGGILD